MRPRKRTTSGSKKSNANHQQSQPSKFGIQHFFERHSQSALSQNPRNGPNPKTSNPNNGIASAENPTTDSHLRNIVAINAFAAPQNIRNEVDSRDFGLRNDVSVMEKSRSDLNVGIADSSNSVFVPREYKDEANSRTDVTSNPSQSTSSENILPVVDDVENQLEVSPEICKSVSVKRFKFSPGMLIKQSQDDGSDEVTWRISPVNERLHTMSKHLPDVVRVLADSARFNSLNFHPCSQNKNFGSAGKLEKSDQRKKCKLEMWISSPPLKAAAKSLMLPNKVSSKVVHSENNEDCNGSNRNEYFKNNYGVISSQSPFKTPPSLSYCHAKPADGFDPSGASDQLGSMQHKKVLLELLDQVEDVLSVKESVRSDTEAFLSRAQNEIYDDRSSKADATVAEVATDSMEKVYKDSCNLYYLVLEVSEKIGPADSSGTLCPFKVLRLLNEESVEERVVHLWDEWYYSIVAPGNSVHLIGEFDRQGKCDVNRDKNFLIVHPEILVSGTRVAASFSCPRRTVLDERLKCSEHSTVALVGTLLHQIFQAGLIRELPTKELLEEYARIVLRKNSECLYACGANENDTHKTLVDAIPRILNWIILFRDSQGSKNSTIDFGSDDGIKKVKISEVIDVEEMVWAPKYGLKGIIDASVRLMVESNSGEAHEKILPLEFKTGKRANGQIAVEHSAQVMLYTLLMSERYMKNIDSGLLYYLQTDQTQGIGVQRSDLVGLIMRRNELANDILKASTLQQLPPMIQSPSMCKGCRHLNVCTIYHKAHGGSAESSGLSDAFDSFVYHLTTVHCAFLQKWDRLIDMEARELEVLKKEIWSSHSLKREDYSSCLSPLVLDNSKKLLQKSSSKGNRFIYCFVRQDSSPVDDSEDGGNSATRDSPATNSWDCTLGSGDYVILSTEPGCLMIASGVILTIDCNHVSVSFSKRLRLPWSDASSVSQDLHHEVWRINKDEVTTSFAIMRFNLVQLFLQNDRSSHLRKMIVDLEAPRFDSGCIFSQDPAVSYIWSEKNLNDDQRRAIIKILTAKDYVLILGMPGTGKTSTMVHAVKALLMRGASILLTSYTNSAVDNLLIKLKAQGIDFIRIGRYEAVHEEVRGHCLSAMDMQSVEDIKQRLDQTKVAAVTCLGITSPLLTSKRFDICIMDEAGQTTLPVSLGPLMFASKFVLVGDHYQLPPLVQSTEARENGMGVSLFCRLSEAHPQAISALQGQYRMCAAIMELSNALIYGNKLHCGLSEVENAKLTYSSSATKSLWLKEVLNQNRPVIFINTDLLPALEAKDGKTLNNPLEAYIIAEVTEELVHKGIKQEDIGIITPYNSQAILIRQAIFSSVEIHTIDKYQGRDKDCILVSFVRSSGNPRSCISSLLGDWHRINVALTRAKKKLIMVGSCGTLSKVPLLKLLIEKVEEQSSILCVSNKDINFKGELRRCSQIR